MKGLRLVAVLGILAFAACAKPTGEGMSAPSPTQSASSPSPTGNSPGTTTQSPAVTVTEGSATTTFALEDCPVADEDFCEVGVDMVNAIASGDADAIVGLSRPGVFECDAIVSDVFSACEPDAVLEGYAVTSVPSTIPAVPISVEVLSPEGYRGLLEAMFANVDRAFTDEHGEGSPTVLGVGQCGGFAIGWRLATGEDGSPARRVFASFGFVVVDGGWVSDSLYLYTPELAAVSDFGTVPLDEIGCDAASNPWPS